MSILDVLIVLVVEIVVVVVLLTVLLRLGDVDQKSNRLEEQSPVDCQPSAWILH